MAASRFGVERRPFVPAAILTVRDVPDEAVVTVHDEAFGSCVSKACWDVSSLCRCCFVRRQTYLLTLPLSLWDTPPPPPDVKALVLVVFYALAVAMSNGDRGCEPGQGRQQPRLRSWLRHERLSVDMTLSTTPQEA